MPGRSPGRKALAHFVLRPFNFRLATEQPFLGSCAPKRLMRPLAVVPKSIRAQRLAHSLVSHRSNVETPEKLALHAQPETFDDGDAALLSHSSKAGFDASSLAPSFVTRLKMCTSVTDNGARTSPHFVNGTLQDAHHIGRGRIVAESSQRKYRPRILVDDSNHPPAKRPTLRQRKRKPRRPKTLHSPDRGQIDMPNLMRPLSDNARIRARRPKRPWLRTFRLNIALPKTPHRRWREQEPRPSQNLSGPPSSHQRKTLRADSAPAR